MTKKSPKSPKLFSCEKCDYECSKQSEWNKHVLTQKHQNNDNELQKNLQNLQNFTCDCGNTYKYRQGLWTHKKKCTFTKETINKEKDETKSDTNIDIDIFDKNLILTLIQQNNELQKQILEVCKNTSINNSNNTNSNNNSNNKTFNLQFFLNEECKDALNIAEFVSSIKVQLEDLETTGRLGYVEGVSRIINKNLNDLDQTKRPIHCSDVKREVLYIKNNDQWVKENENKPILTKAIKQIANENIKQISEWRKKYPDCTDSDSRKNDMYLNIVSNAMSGSTAEEQSSNYEKIISKVAKEVVIEK
jgi:hypothetical protein